MAADDRGPGGPRNPRAQAVFVSCANGTAGRLFSQRVKTYIVISNPKRISVKLGFVHIIGALRGGLKTGPT